MKTFVCRTMLVLLTVAVQINYGHTQEIKRFVGEWEVWIPGAINYTSRDAAVYRVYTPGAPMNRLTIKSDGKYVWGNKNGSLERVTPWHAQEGRDYYRISDKKGNTYDFWYKAESDQLIVLFGEVGGHAATGSRWGNSTKQPAPTQADTTTAPEKPIATPANPINIRKSDTENLYAVGDQVEILWSGGWYQGSILESTDNKYKVRYTDWGSLYDEWVDTERLRKASKD